MTYGANTQSSPGSTWSEQSPPLTGPGGRPYRFRNGIESPQAAQQPMFRPDARLGQQPKNWSSDPAWASDPVLQQGLVFRPLPKKDAGRPRSDTGGRAARPAVPPVYPYAGYAEFGGYPAVDGRGLPGDPYPGVPLWPFPGSLGGWAPGW